jgi:hypothetical protein
MSRFTRTGALAGLLAVVALGLVAAGCGEEHETEVVEGEPIELGDLHLNVQLTRFLNPNDREDAEYLEGQPPPPPGEAYLGVFIEAENEGDEDVRLPTIEQMEVIDTTEQEYDPVESDSVFAFDFGTILPPGEAIPLPDTASASGPIQGQVAIFLVDQGVSENRPLELHLSADDVEGPDSGGADGIIELDI